MPQTFTARAVMFPMSRTPTRLGRSLVLAVAFFAAFPLSSAVAQERAAGERAPSPPSSGEQKKESSAATEAGARAAHGPSTADRAAAQALFDEGRELMEQGRSADACPRFEESDRLEPALGTRFHLANCYEELGKLASAHALYLQVASEAATRNQAARERVARERAQAVEPRLARLTIEVPFSPSPALRVERDGTLVGAAQWGLPVPVDPGVHHLNASAPGREPWAADVEIPGEPGVTRVNVPPLAEHRQPFFAPLSRKLGLAALGVGAGTIGLGSVFAVQAISKKNASDRAGCSERDCQNARGLSLRREALRAGDRATWAMGLGLVGLGAAAALFWIWPTPEDGDDTNELELSPVANLSSASLRLNGRF
jgi:hypothetical protein